MYSPMKEVPSTRNSIRLQKLGLQMAERSRATAEPITLLQKVRSMWSQKNRRSAIFPRFGVAGTGILMGLDGVKKVETDKEEGVSY